MLKTTAKTALAALVLTIAATAALPASADQNRPSIADQQVQMAMLADMVNNSALTIQENGDALSIDDIEKQFSEAAAENLVAASPEEGC